MKLVSLLPLVISLLQLYGSSGHSIGIDDPTPEEISRGFKVKPSANWGLQAREQNSLRILCLGGSNTAIDYYELGYVHLLDTFVKSRLSSELYKNHKSPTSEHLRDHSYAHNNGLRGRGPEYWVGKQLLFESSMDPAEWPNVVILDTYVNIQEDTLNAGALSLTLEKLVRGIDFKFRQKGLSPPDYLFLNLPWIVEMVYYAQRGTSVAERERWLQSYNAALPTNKNIQAAQIIEDFAVSHGMPLIDLQPVMKPAATRFFLSSNRSTFTTRPWKYMNNDRIGRHLSWGEGTRLLTNQLLAPFFKQVMAQEFNETSSPEVVGGSMKNYTSSRLVVDMELASVLAYPLEDRPSDFTETVVDQDLSDWAITPESHYKSCFGSYQKGSVGVMKIGVPEACTAEQPCRVELSFLHSWNASYVGNASCTLQPSNGNQLSATMGESVLFVDGQASVSRSTFPVEHTFPLNVTHGNYSAKCVNQSNLFSCIVELRIVQSMFV